MRCMRKANVRTKKQQKDPVQLDLFEPYVYGFEFKVIVTNKLLGAAGALILTFCPGRNLKQRVTQIFESLDTAA